MKKGSIMFFSFNTNTDFNKEKNVKSLYFFAVLFLFYNPLNDKMQLPPFFWQLS